MDFGISGQWRGDRVTRAIGAGMGTGLTRAAQRLRALSIPRTPIDTSNLRNKTRVIPATPNVAEALVVNDAPYAVIQHEKLDYHHDEGEAKFLERPLNEHRAELMHIVATDIRSAVENA